MPVSRLGRLALVAIVVARAGAVFGAAVWWSGDYTISRFLPATGELRTLNLSSPVRALAPLGDGGAWVIEGDLLIRRSPGLEVAAAAAEPLDSRIPTRLAATSDGGVWVASGAALRRLDGAGRVVTTWEHRWPISALSVGGPDALWVGDVIGVTRYDAHGRPARSIRLAEAPPSAMLFDAAGGYLWVLAEGVALQLDALGSLAEHARITLPAETSAVAFDVASGMLWMLSSRRLTAFDRDGRQVADHAIAAGTLSTPSTLASDALQARLWIGDLRGATVFNRETLQWMRPATGDRALLAGSFHSTVPTVAQDDSAGAATLRLLMSVTCDGAACVATPAYLRELHLHASAAGADVAELFDVDRDAGAAKLHDVAALARDADAIRAWVTDGYGNRSEELTIDLSSLRAASGPSLRPKILPTVAITAPANNAMFVAPATIAVAATAADSDGTVTKVEFYRDTVLLGSDTTSPYTYSWVNVAVGTYKLTAKAYDNAGGVTTSAIVNVQVKANVAPTVTLTAPANNASYTAPATIAMTATAADSDGTIGTVDFYQGTTKLGSDTTAPYAFTWGNVAGGTYTLAAKAIDDKGAVTTSATITVKVNKPPTVALSAPADNTVLVTPASATITATASDSDGSVSKVEFYRNGVLLGTDTTSPYSYSWNNIPTGTYSLTARATDNLGATTVSTARTFTVAANQPPAVAITSPASGASVVAGAPVPISATASDPDGTIAKVEFYASHPAYGQGLLGTDTTSPYGITTTLSAGVNTITAVATDNKGATATSSPVTVSATANQDPSVSITSPLPGQAFPSLSPPDIALAATASDIDGSIVNVKFYYLPTATADNPDPVRVLIGTATSPPYQVTWHGVPLTGVCDAYYYVCSPDHYFVSAEATDNAGGTWEEGVFITVPMSSPYSLRMGAPSEYATYNAPATIVMTAIPTPAVVSGDSISKVEFLANGGVIAAVSGPPNGASGEYVAVWRNVGSGSHAITARLYDAAGFMVSSDGAVPVRVRDFTEPPTVTIAAPPNEQTYRPWLSNLLPNIAITAVASDTDGTIAQVGVMVDDISLSTGTSSPFTAVWNAVPEGVHAIAATATDNGGRHTTSRPIFIDVLPFPRLQAVVLTSPAPGMVTNPVVLEADVGAPDGGVARVQFYYGSTLLGAVDTPPYSLTASLPNASYSLKAVAVMFTNFSTASTPVNVTVSGANAAPMVTLTSPAAGQSFPLGSTVALAATATDPDGTIAKVEFRVGGSVVATDTSAPYTGTWTPSAAGSYALTALATDNQNGTQTTAPTNVTVVSNSPPQVSLTAPTTGQSFFAGVPITVTASASDPGGSVTKVEFLAGSTLIGTATSSPYTVSWTAAAPGSYALAARATDNSGAIATSTPVNVTITANAIPAVTLSMPRAGQSFVTGGTITLIATASDADGGIARVEFYSGTTLIATASAAPYTFSWTSVPSGTYTLTAKVIDSHGAITTSVPVTITVQPLALNVTSPAPSASIPADFVLITGTYTAPANSGVTVNGIVATTDGQGNFFVNNFPLSLGANLLTVVLATQDGHSTSVSQSISSSGAAPYRISADPDVGFGPVTSTIKVDYRGTSPVTSVSFANLGPGVLDMSSYTPDAIATLTYSSPGMYQPRFTLIDAAGNVYTQTVTIVILDRAVVVQTLTAVWEGFAAALTINNLANALSYLDSAARRRYAPILAQLSASMPPIVSSWSAPDAGTIDSRVAELVVRRTILGIRRLFFVYLLRETDDIWRINSM